MLSDREKLELAQVFASVLEPRLCQLETSIAEGIVETLDQYGDMLAGVFEHQNKERLAQMAEAQRRAGKSTQWLDRILK